MAFLLRAFSRVEKQKDNDSSAEFVNKLFQSELSNIRSKLAVEDDDIQFLLEMIYDSSFPESQKFLKDPTKDRLFAHKETLSKLLFGLAAKGVPVTQLIVAHMQKYGIDSISGTLLTLLELIRPLLISKEVPEFTSDDLLDAIDVQWHSPLRVGSRPQSPFQSPRTSVSMSPRFSVSSPRSPFSIYYPGQTQAQDLVSPRRSGPLGSIFSSQSDDSPRPSPNNGWDASPSFEGVGLSLPQGQNLQPLANEEKELDNENLTISQRIQQSQTPRTDSSLTAFSTELNESAGEAGKNLPESMLQNSATRIQKDDAGAQERHEAPSKVQHGTSSELPHVVHLETMQSLKHSAENTGVEGAADSEQPKSASNHPNHTLPSNMVIENQQESGGGKGLHVGDSTGSTSGVSSSLPEEEVNDTHQEVIPVTYTQREAGQESEAENKLVEEMFISDLSDEEEFNTKSGVEGVHTKPSSEIRRDSLDRTSKDMDDSKISEDEDAETRRELGDAPIDDSDYSNFVCGNSPVEGHIFGNFDGGNNTDTTFYSKDLPPHSKGGQRKEVQKDESLSPGPEHYVQEGGEGDPTSFANMPEENLVSEDKLQEGKNVSGGDIPGSSSLEGYDGCSVNSLACLDEAGKKPCSFVNDEASIPTRSSFSEVDRSSFYPVKDKSENAISTLTTHRNEEEDTASDVHPRSSSDLSEAMDPLPVAVAEKQISPGSVCEAHSIHCCDKNPSSPVRGDDGEGPPSTEHPVNNAGDEPFLLLGMKEEATEKKTGNPTLEIAKEEFHRIPPYDSTIVEAESPRPVGIESGVVDVRTSEISSDNVGREMYQISVDSHEEQSTADSIFDPNLIGDPSLLRNDNVKEKLHFSKPSSKFENLQAGHSLLFEQGAEETEAQKAEGADVQHPADRYNFLGGHRDLKEHHWSDIPESALSTKSGVESLPSMGGDEAEVDGGVIHDIELDDKSLPVQVASITGSSEKEADFVEDGSVEDNTTLRQFTDGADFFPAADTKHGDVASSISSQVCQDIHDDGQATTSDNVHEAVYLGDRNSNVASGDIVSVAQTEGAENSLCSKRVAETVQIEGEDETTEQIEVASITPAEVKIGFGEEVIPKAESTSGQELAPAHIDDSNTANSIEHHVSHTAKDVEIISPRFEHERGLSEADVIEFPVSSYESKAGFNDFAGETDSSGGSSENEEVPRNFGGEIPLNVLAHTGEANVISGDEESKLVQTRKELFCVEKHHDSPGISCLEISPTNDDDRGGEGNNAPAEENVHGDGLSCDMGESKAGGNEDLFLEEAVASEHLKDDFAFAEKAISCVPDEGNEINVPAISRSEDSVRNDESDGMLTSNHYSEERVVAEVDKSMAGEADTELMDVDNKEEALTSRSAKEGIIFPKDCEIVSTWNTLKPSPSIDDSDKPPNSQHSDQVGLSEKMKEPNLYEGKISVPATSEGDVVVTKHIINRTDLTGGQGENLSPVQPSKSLITGIDKHDVGITNDFDRHDVDSFLAGHIGDDASFADCDLKLVDAGYVVPSQAVADEASKQIEGAAKRKEIEDTGALDFDDLNASGVKGSDTGDSSGNKESNRAENKDITHSKFEKMEVCPEEIKDTSRRADHMSDSVTSDNAADSILAKQRRYFEANNPFLVSGDRQAEVLERPDTSRNESDSSVEVLHESPAQVEDESQCVESKHGQDRSEDNSEDSRSNYEGKVVESPDTSRNESDSSVEVLHESPAQFEDESQCVESKHVQDRSEDNSNDSRSNYEGEVVESPDPSCKKSDSSVQVLLGSPAQIEHQSKCVASNHGQGKAEYNSKDKCSNYEGEVVVSPDTSPKESDSSVEVVHESPAQVEDQSQCVASNHDQGTAENSPSNDSPTTAVNAPVEAETKNEAFQPAVEANAKEEVHRSHFGPQITDFRTEALKKNLCDSRHPNFSKEQPTEKGSDAYILQVENPSKPTSDETKLVSKLDQSGHGQMSFPELPLTGISHQETSKDNDRMYDSASNTPAPLSSTQLSAPILLEPNNNFFDRNYRQYKSHMRQWRLKFSRICCYCCCRCSPTL